MERVLKPVKNPIMTGVQWSIATQPLQICLSLFARQFINQDSMRDAAKNSGPAVRTESAVVRIHPSWASTNSGDGAVDPVSRTWTGLSGTQKVASVPPGAVRGRSEMGNSFPFASVIALE
jgi:hypothetical protein